MAIQTYEASYRKYFGNTYDKIHKDSTHDEVRQVYDIWAVDYDKVSIIIRLDKSLADVVGFGRISIRPLLFRELGPVSRNCR